MSRLRLLQLAFVAAFVGFFVWHTDFGELHAALKQVDERYLVVAFLLNLLVLALLPLRSGLALRRLGYAVPANVLVTTTVLGFVAGGLTPAAAGELVRVQTLREAAAVTVEDGLAVAAYERVLSTGLQVLVLIPLVVATALSTGWALVAAALCFAVWGLSTVAASSILVRLPGHESVGGAGFIAGGTRYFLRLAQQLRVLARDRALLLWASLISMVLTLIFSLQVWLIARSLSTEINLREACIAYTGAILAAVASLLPFGFGVGDGSMAALMHKFGLSLEQGEVVALLVRALMTLPLVLAALLCYAYLQGQSRMQRASIVERPGPESSS